MLSVIVIVFQAVALLFIGIFARTTDTTNLTTSNITLFNDCLALLLAFTLMYSPFRKLSLYTFVALIITISLTAQTNLLFGTFWDSCFKGFGNDFQISVTTLIRCAFAALSVLLTVLDFAGLFQYWQVYFLMAPIMTIGYSLNSAIIVYGLKTFDGGGGLMVFMYSGLCSLMIWALCIRGKIDKNRYRIRQSYINHTIGFIGVAVAFIVWPKFNMGGALVSYFNVYTTTITSSSFLQNSALGNTFLALTAAVLLSVLFASKDAKQDKMKYKVYIDCFMNAGIIVASYQDIVLNPVAGIVMASLSTISTVIIHKYFLTASETQSQSAFKNLMINYGKVIYRIVFSFLGIIVASIVVATRQNLSPSLLFDNYSRIAGFQIVAFIVVAIIGILFGIITALVINAFLSYKQKAQEEEGNAAELPANIELEDEHYFIGLDDEAHPIYYDVFDNIRQKEEEKINLAQYTTKVIKQSLLGASDNPLRSIVKEKPAQKPVQKSEAKIIKNYSQSRGNLEVSQMKKQLPVQSRKKEPDERGVSRRLSYSNDEDSQIRKEEPMKSKSMARM